MLFFLKDPNERAFVDRRRTVLQESGIAGQCLEIGAVHGRIGRKQQIGAVGAVGCMDAHGEAARRERSVIVRHDGQERRCDVGVPERVFAARFDPERSDAERAEIPQHQQHRAQRILTAEPHE